VDEAFLFSVFANGKTREKVKSSFLRYAGREVDKNNWFCQNVWARLWCCEANGYFCDVFYKIKVFQA
jgi:hypothetical protein